MESYIEYLTDTNKSIDLEMNNYLRGGSLLEIDGGFPQFYECISNSEQKYSDNDSNGDREKARSKTNINKNSLSNILDNRRKTPFISVEKNTNIVNRIDVSDDDDNDDKQLLANLGVNSDSIIQLDGGNTENIDIDIEGGNSIDLPENLSILSNKNILDNKEMSLNNNELVKENNLDITEIFIKKDDLQINNKITSNIDVVDVNLGSETILPTNIEINSINNLDLQKGGIGENLEDINAVSDSIALPENINIVNINATELQEGGNIENLEDVTSETIALPEFINIFDINTADLQKGGDIENLEDITSETVALPDFINIVDINTVEVQEGGDIENLEAASDSIALPENINIVDIVVQDGGNESSTFTILSGTNGINLKRENCIPLELKLNIWHRDIAGNANHEVRAIGDALFNWGRSAHIVTAIKATNSITVTPELFEVLKKLLDDNSIEYTISNVIITAAGGNIENLEDITSDTIALPENIDIVDIVDLQEGGDFEDVTSETVALPEFINIVDFQEGGDLEDIASETELDLPQNIEIVNII